MNFLVTRSFHNYFNYWTFDHIVLFSVNLNGSNFFVNGSKKIYGNMKTKFIKFVLLMLILVVFAVAQTTDKKAEKENRRIAKEKEIAALVDSKIFVFTATRAIPTGYKPVDLTTNPNFIKLSPDLIVSEMPYFGRAYSVSYGGDGGLKFWGKPEVFTIERKSKNYALEAKVKGTDDSYTINLTVSFEGSSSMSIVSNNRSFISYNGEIFATEKQFEKK